LKPVPQQKRAALGEEALRPSERPLHGPLSPSEPRYVNDWVENSGLTSWEVPAALFDRELRGVIRQLPGKQFLKVLL
jgi:hypothetical protein